MSLILPMLGNSGAAAGAALAGIDYRAFYSDGGNRTSYNFNDSDLGSPDGTSIVVVIAGARGDGGNDRYVTSMTIDGATATQVGSDTTSGDARHCSMWYAQTANSTGDISLSTSARMSNMGIHVIRLNLLESVTPLDDADDANTATPSGTVTTSPGGAVIVGHCFDDDGTFTPSNHTQLASNNIDNDHGLFAGSAIATGSSLTVGGTASSTDGNGSDFKVGSWR